MHELITLFLHKQKQCFRECTWISVQLLHEEFVPNGDTCTRFTSPHSPYVWKLSVGACAQGINLLKYQSQKRRVQLHVTTADTLVSENNVHEGIIRDGKYISQSPEWWQCHFGIFKQRKNSWVVCVWLGDATGLLLPGLAWWCSNVLHHFVIVISHF